jgi:hypothetical protein
LLEPNEQTDRAAVEEPHPGQVEGHIAGRFEQRRELRADFLVDIEVEFADKSRLLQPLDQLDTGGFVTHSSRVLPRRA